MKNGNPISLVLVSISNNKQIEFLNMTEIKLIVYSVLLRFLLHFLP